MFSTVDTSLDTSPDLHLFLHKVDDNEDVTRLKRQRGVGGCTSLGFQTSPATHFHRSCHTVGLVNSSQWTQASGADYWRFADGWRWWIWIWFESFTGGSLQAVPVSWKVIWSDAISHIFQEHQPLWSILLTAHKMKVFHHHSTKCPAGPREMLGVVVFSGMTFPFCDPEQSRKRGPSLENTAASNRVIIKPLTSHGCHRGAGNINRLRWPRTTTLGWRLSKLRRVREHLRPKLLQLPPSKPLSHYGWHIMIW